MRKIALPNSCETLENWKSRIRVNLHFFVSVGSSLSLHCTVKREEIAYSLYDPFFDMVEVHCRCQFSQFGCFGLFSKERVTRRVVSGRSKQQLLRPETTLLVTL